MCLLCDDEKAYQAYMNYLDAMERQARETGKSADPEAGVNAVLDALQADANAKAKDKAKLANDDPKNDKTLSPFFCSPINK